MPKVVLYVTASCPYCIRAKMLLDKKGVDYIEHRVDQDLELREEMHQKSNRFSVPQIFIDDFHIGGFDDMYMLDLDDKLDPLLFPEKNDG